MEKKGISEPMAYRILQKKAMDNRMTMKDIAEFIVYVYETI